MNGTALNPTLPHHPRADAMPSRRIDVLVGWFGAVLTIICTLAVAAGAWSGLTHQTYLSLKQARRLL